MLENVNVEFKREYVPDIRKEVIAFANAEGGIVYIGVSDDGTVIGVENTDEEMLKTVNSLKDAIVPDIMPFVRVYAETINDKSIVKVEVSTGTNRPYYLREKGLKPSGVFVRKGSSAQPMSEESIKEMLLQSSGRSFEMSRSINQSLSFTCFTTEMQRRGIEIGDAQMRTLKLIGDDGLYTNLALLLSDQCENTTKVAVFQGIDKEVFRDRQEFSGSILRQLEDVYSFVDLMNKTKATFSGLNRTDLRDYPEQALRETLLNSIVHRDYSFSGSNLINIYDDRIEFVSLGGLVPGLELQSIFLGASQSRNPQLAAVFYHMRLIESYGTGIAKIERSYADCELKPKFETAKGVFRVTLPNKNEECNVQKTYTDEKQKYTGTLDEQEAKILHYLSINGSITRQETEKLIDVGTTRAFYVLDALCRAGKLQRHGRGRSVSYALA